MKKVKYLILGGGPSGLTLANFLIDKGMPKDQVVLLEKESTVVMLELFTAPLLGALPY